MELGRGVTSTREGESLVDVDPAVDSTSAAGSPLTRELSLDEAGSRESTISTSSRRRREAANMLGEGLGARLVGVLCVGKPSG